MQSLFPMNPVLLVDDEPHTLSSFDIALKSSGINNTIRCHDSRNVMSIINEQEIELILLDLIMPHISGQEILTRISEDYPEIPIIIITGVNEVDSAVLCLKLGAFDYILKPVDMDRLVPAVKRAIEVRRLRRENALLSSRFMSKDLKHPEAFKAIITKNPAMQSMFKYCEAVAEGQQPVLITGETGVGKELVAQALHNASGRQGKFVAVNVAGLDDHVFTDTLFGHAKGAFTGADLHRAGLIEKAVNGTLFLDEIGDLNESSQVKLLRFMEEREYYPLGSDVAKTSSARLIAATHKDLAELKQEGKFRKDFYYRLCTHHVQVVPLRERKDDIPMLLNTFLAAAAKEFGKQKPTFHRELVTLLNEYNFPGNVREFRAMVYDAISGHTSKMLSSEPFKKYILKARDQQISKQKTKEDSGRTSSWVSSVEQLPTLKEADRILVDEALRRSNNNQRVAALMLGITPQALNQRLKRK